MHTPKRITASASLALMVAAFLFALLTGCGDSTPKMKLADINGQTNTFNFVDVRSGKKITYDKLIYKDKEVVDTHCITGINKAVIFAIDNKTIIRTPGRVAISGGSALTEHATIKYKLENGTLTILGAN